MFFPITRQGPQRWGEETHMSHDFRFNILLRSLERFDELKDDMRRVHNFLESAIERAWRDAGRTNLADYHNLVVSCPIGDPVRRIMVEARVRIDSPKRPFQIRLVDSNGVEISPDMITLDALEILMSNPSPMIDAAAKLCDELGCIEKFKWNVGRFYPHMEYHI